MIQLTFVVVMNVFGLLLASWGVSMLLGTHNPFLPAVDATITVFGLVIAMAGTAWMAVLLLIGSTREQRVPEVSTSPARSTSPTTPVPHRDKLSRAMQELQESALILIERRRELHHLNVKQWHHDHRDETNMEIEAAKRYRTAKNNLELYRLSLPTQFWGPVDGFAEFIEESITREAYSPPNDKGVHEALNRNWHSAMREINDISFGIPPAEPMRATSLN